VKPRVVDQVFDVVDAAGREVVDDVDVVSPEQTRVSKVRSDESSTTSDQNAQEGLTVWAQVVVPSYTCLGHCMCHCDQYHKTSFPQKKTRHCVLLTA
jgi:hypothetical protein